MKTTKWLMKVEPKQPSKNSLLLKDEIGKLIEAEQGLTEEMAHYLQDHHKRIAFDIDYALQYIPKHHTVLDVGSSPYLLAGALKKLGYPVVALDCTPEKMQGVIKRMGVTVVKCNVELEKLPFPNHAFDTVIFNEIFEHLRVDPISTLTEILRVIKPGGMLWLSTPNMRSLGGIYNLVVKQQGYSCVGDIYTQYAECGIEGRMGHVREYTTLEICQFLEKIGFEIKEVIYRGEYYRLSKQVIIKLLPSLRPFMSIVAVKPTRQGPARKGSAWNRQA